MSLFKPYKNNLRSDDLDIESFSINEIYSRFNNLMWFCGPNSHTNRDVLISFVNKFSKVLNSPPEGYFREGYRPVPKGVSSFMFFTRKVDPSRINQAFLHFEFENSYFVHALSLLKTNYRIEKKALTRSLRTGVGLKSFNLDISLDYIAHMPYKELDKVIKASNYKKPDNFDWKNFWDNVYKELSLVKTNIVTLHRINPYSPHTHLISYFSTKEFSPSNVLNVVIEKDKNIAKAFCVLLNSIVFLSQFFLLKEDTTGRYANIRFYDFYEMNIFPHKEHVSKLAKIFDDFSDKEFPSLKEQLDSNFNIRYDAFWKEKKKKQISLFPFNQPINTSNIRLSFDVKVFDALDIKITKKELNDVYLAIVQDMIITRGLKRD